MLKSIHRDALQWWKGPDKKYFCVMLGFAVVVYFPLISQRLVNTFDGLWNGSWFIGRFWEVSIGRWLWPVADFVRFGVQTEPLNSLLTLAMVVLSMTVIRKDFVQNDGLMSWLAGMIFVSGAVVGVWLSYRYMSPIGSRVRDSFEVYEECRFQWCGHSDIEFGIVSSKSGMLLYDLTIISAAPVVSGSGTQQDL